MTKLQKTVRSFAITMTFVLGGLAIVVAGTVGERWQHERAEAAAK